MEAGIASASENYQVYAVWTMGAVELSPVQISVIPVAEMSVPKRAVKAQAWVRDQAAGSSEYLVGKKVPMSRQPVPQALLRTQESFRVRKYIGNRPQSKETTHRMADILNFWSGNGAGVALETQNVFIEISPAVNILNHLSKTARSTGRGALEWTDAETFAK